MDPFDLLARWGAWLLFAALLAERLLLAGYERVRVLTGGEDALAVLAIA